MNKIEKEIQGRLSDQASLQGIDQDQLWASISAAQVENVGKRKRRGFIFLLSATLLTATSVVLMISNNSKGRLSAYSPRVEKSAVLEAGIDTEELGRNGLSYWEQKEVYPQIEGGVIPSKQPTRNTLTGITLNSNELKSAKEELKESNEAPELIEAFKGLKAEETLKNRSVLELVSKTEEELAETNYQPENSQNPERKEEFTQIISDKKPSEISEKVIGELAFRSGLLKQSDPLSIPIERVENLKQNKPLAFDFYGGSTFMNTTFQSQNENSDFVEALNSSFSVDPGLRIGALVRIKERGALEIKTGLEYASFNDRFDKVFISDTTVIDQNLNTLEAINTRTVRHFNRASILTLPLEASVFKDLGNYRISLATGASYSMVINQSGRGLGDPLSVVDYSSSNRRLENFISFRIKPSIGFKMSEKILLNASCLFSVQAQNNKAFNDTRSNSLVFMPALGLQVNY